MGLLLQKMLDGWYYTWIDYLLAQHSTHGTEHLQAEGPILLFVQYTGRVDGLSHKPPAHSPDT